MFFHQMRILAPSQHMNSGLSCPKCGCTYLIERVIQTLSGTVGFCATCGTQSEVPLPRITKKLIYLDQWFLSAACLESDMSHAREEVRLCEKLQTLKAQQKVYLVISDIHSRETAGIPEEQKSRRAMLWDFANGLADGCIGSSWPEVFAEQQRRGSSSQRNWSRFLHRIWACRIPTSFELACKFR